MKKSYKNTNTAVDTNTSINISSALQASKHDIELFNRSQAAQASLKENLETLYNGISSAPYPKASSIPAYSTAVGFKADPSITPCQYYPKIIVDGVDVVKMLTNIAVVTGALRDSTSVANLDVVQHYSAERLAQFIINGSKKIISGSGDAVAELTEWLKSKAE